MSLTVVFRRTALRNLARIRGEDKDLFGQTRRAIALLADQPYPKNAVAWGATGVYRLHSGGIRVLYEVDDEAAAVNWPLRCSRLPHWRQDVDRPEHVNGRQKFLTSGRYLGPMPG
jgi:mRNA-degrading endonuclease RelE of RelBE toxin-antitoxin system